jgi:alpha-beta hydrolase superfamily lysophospholipase
MRAALTKRAARDTTPVLAVIGVGEGEDRAIAALNIALSAARDWRQGADDRRRS